MIGAYYTKVTWKKLGLFFLVCALMTLIIINAYIRNQMNTAVFTAFLVVIGIAFFVPFFLKIGIFIYAFIKQMMIMNNKDFREALVQSIASKNHHVGDSDVSMIIDDLFFIVRKIYPSKKPNEVKLTDKNFEVLNIDGTAYKLNDLISHKDLETMERRFEIDFLMTKKIKLEDLEKLLNQKIMKEWVEKDEPRDDETIN